MKKSSIISCLLGLMPAFLSAQSYQLPQVIPPSPQAGEFVKYIDFPIDLSSGLPKVDIPIYLIKSKELSLPISISYHASGLRPNKDESGVIALGWHLNAFGLVSRSIKRQPDERYWNYLIPLESDITSNTNNLEEDPDAIILDNLVRGYKESEPDDFSYSLPEGEGGKFVFNRSSTLGEFLKPFTLPFKPVKITPNLSQENSSNIFDYFDIRDEHGVLYRFGKSIQSGQTVWEKYFNINNSSESGITSWLLTEMISADKSDTIHFQYDNMLAANGGTTIIKRHHAFSKSAHITRSPSGEDTHYSQSGIFTAHGYSQKRITQISFKSGYVKFIYRSNTYPDHLLDKIEVYQKGSGSPVQTIRFTQTKYHSQSTQLNWHKLDEVSFYDSGNTKVDRYSFEYHTGSFPTIKDTYTNETFSVDFWGYYNGGINSDLMPSFQWSVTPGGPNLFGTANRNANSSYAKTGILTKITYPTGGERVFEYEGNSDYLGQAAGGLRIKTITNKTGVQQVKRTFTYWGISNQANQGYFQSHSIDVPNGNSKTDNYTASSEPHCDIHIHGSPVRYTKVTEYDGDQTSNNGRIEHTFDISFTPSIKLDALTIALGYPWTFGGGSGSRPMQVYYTDVVPGSVFEKETRVFDASGNLVKTTTHHYAHNLKQRLRGFTVSRVVNTSYLLNKAYFYTFYNYHIDQLSQKLDSTITVEYQQGAQLVKKEIYQYNNNLFVTEKRSQKSDHSWQVSRFKYPHDFSTLSPYDDMVNNRNMLAPVIEQSDYHGTSTLLQSIKTNYKSWGNNVIAPQSVQVKKGTNAYQSRLEYIAYDQTGNLKSVSKDEGMKISYLWGYNDQYPIAEVKNADHTDIAHTSFEADSKGGWNYTGNGIPIFRYTGKLAYVLKSGSPVSKSGLNSNKTYVLTYWVKGTTQATVTGGTTVASGTGQVATVDGWTQYKRTFTGATSVSISYTNTSGILIDEVRLYSLGAQMITYTYDPLVGMTSQTDASGRVVHYEYDSFQRLQAIRDQEGKLAEEYDYRYRNQ